MMSKDTVRLTADVPVEFHRELKSFVYSHGLNMRDYLVSRLAMCLKQDKEREGGENWIKKNGF